ncbi:RNA polymerase sigma factor [Phycicoccus sp. CSK15P-2]|uniref:RNA polymerase sigma factor n=1 Tax=Phycicoccus sp. CSK15P-2 TaxID=2807627 RepID=UPI00194E250C|nr:RNA polymerase sigma factor [Phycicoccus sp. CSK15P-2]MBM6404420.1 RNA polymerase sigma factor [Phycicoccus sp. CSK15P-2]
MASAEERFTRLFDATRLPLLAYAVRRVGDPSDAADVVAETYLVAWRRLDEVPGGDEARPWLFGVARRVLANHHRGEQRRLALADRLRDSLTSDAVPGPEAVAGRGSHRAERVRDAMERLSENDREILRLVAWEQLARDEIAVAMGLSRATVRLRLHRARRRLTEAMDASHEIPQTTSRRRRAGRTASTAPMEESR